MSTGNIQRPYSRAAFQITVNLRSETAQRMIEREYERVTVVLYHLSVVRRIIASEEEADVIENEVRALISSVRDAVEKEIARLSKLRADHGILIEPQYTHPSECQLQITSPLANDYLVIIQSMDEVIMYVDSLWLAGVLTNAQRANAVFLWQRTILRLGRRIIGRNRSHPSPKTESPHTETGHTSVEPSVDDIEETNPLTLNVSDTQLIVLH